jgi:hypothetical protein
MKHLVKNEVSKMKNEECRMKNEETMSSAIANEEYRMNFTGTFFDFVEPFHRML